MHVIVIIFLIALIIFSCAVDDVSNSRQSIYFHNRELNSMEKILLIFDERSLTIVLFKMNNELFNLCEHETEDCDLNDCLLTRSLFIKITLNEIYKRLCSCFSTRIKIIFTRWFIMNNYRLIISLSLRLIVAFDFFRDEHNDFKSKKNSSLKLKSKSFQRKSQHENVKNDRVFINVYADMI